MTSTTPSTLTRRHFLGAVVAASLAVAAENAAPPIIDSHIHIWDLNRLNPPWLAARPGILNRRYMPEEYRQATAGLGIERAVYVEIAEAPERRPAEAEYVTELIRAKTPPLAAAVIGADPLADGFAAYARSVARVPQIKGMRCFYKKGSEDSAAFVAGVRLLGELGLTFDIGSHLPLDGALKLVKACPDTRFILNHCGNGSGDWFDPAAANNPALRARRETWETGIAALADCPNVVCKISGVAETTKGDITPSRLAPVITYCIDRFGEDRSLFASNWPVCLKAITLKDWLLAVQQATAPRGARFARKLFHDNTIKCYRLDA